MNVNVQTEDDLIMMENISIQFNDPIEVLMKEHDEGREHLEKLQEAVKSIQVNGFSSEAFQQISLIIEYCSTKLRQHNLKEEKYLFSKLDKHVFEFPNAIRHERREMWQAFNELTTAVKDVEDGRVHGTTIKDIIHSAEVVVERFKTQIEKENTIVFPQVKRLFTANEYAQLAKEISL